MANLLELPDITDTKAFLQDRWDELCDDPDLAKLDDRIETDRFGQIIMTSPAEWTHGAKQMNLGTEMKRLLPGGTAIAECPVATTGGVKVADAAWISDERLKQAGNRKCFSTAPEICVEVISPCNTRAEIAEKRRLYFDAGAEELWVCDKNGALHFFLKAAPDTEHVASLLCPDMPDTVNV